MEKKIEFKNVEIVNDSVFKTTPSIDNDKMIQDGKIVFSTKHPEEVKRAERVSSIPKIEVDEEKVKEIADQINQEIDDDNYCVECRSEDLTWDFRNQYHDFWICKNCDHEFRTQIINDEE